MAQRGEARVVLELGPPDRLGERVPHGLVAAGDIEGPVGGRVNAVWRRERMMVASRSGRNSGVKVDSRRPAEHADQRFQQRSFDALAAAVAMARMEREENALRGEDSAQQIADRDPDAQ